MSVLVLHNGPARVELLPAVGGSVGRFTWHGQDVLRPAPAGTTEVLDTGNFALVPFCNRIRNGRLKFGGHVVALSPNLGDHPHALHGQAWRRAWSVVSASETHAVLAFDHAPGEWPWAYRAEQHFILDHRSLRQALSVTNTGTEPMPVGLGFHPYFPVRENERLKADVSGVWMIDGDCLPTTHVEGPWRSDWAAGASTASSQLIDNCYTGWSGVATLAAPAGPRKVLTASPECRWLHVYLPPGGDFVCVEPVSNRPDPFNGEDSGIKVVAPGETAAVWMEIAVS
ncbi:aldose 1-epimerase [Caulobacter sp.]|uniref:aldose 1-epimerase n=1 Tax=Caulobacter sp. TaxID=78 RepID=UPI003BAFDCC8